MELLEDGLSLSLRIILKMAKSTHSEVLNYSFLSKMEELNSMESLVDLLKFINNDGDARLVKCKQIQDLLKNSFPLIKQEIHTSSKHAKP